MWYVVSVAPLGTRVFFITQHVLPGDRIELGNATYEECSRFIRRVFR